MTSSLVKKFERQKTKSKILELIPTGATYNEIAEQLGISRQMVTDTLKEELMSATTPEKILELREHQTQTLNSHTPRLHKRFLTQSNLSERLANKYEAFMDEDDQGMYNFGYLFDMYILEGLDEENARIRAKEEIAQYRANREQIAKEMERTAKLADQHYMTLLKHQERLAKLNGLDVPVTSTLLIHRSDELKIQLQQEIINTQKELSQPVLDAETVEESDVG